MLLKILLVGCAAANSVWAVRDESTRGLVASGVAISVGAARDELIHGSVSETSVSNRTNSSQTHHSEELGKRLGDGVQLYRLRVSEVSHTLIAPGIFVIALGVALCVWWSPAVSGTSEIVVDINGRDATDKDGPATPADACTSNMSGADDQGSPTRRTAAECEAAAAADQASPTGSTSVECDASGTGSASVECQATDRPAPAWLTAVECEAAGLPAISEWKRKLLFALPWEWFGGTPTQMSADDDGWERVIFPWTIFTVQEVFKAKGVSQCSIPPKIANRLALGKMHLVHIPGDVRVLPLMRVTLVLCVRVFDCSGRVLVRVSVTSPDENSPWASEKPEWLGIALEKSEGLVQKAKEIIKERAKIPVEAVSFSCGNTIWSDPVLDKDLDIPRVFCRHFVDARLVEPVPKDLAERLSLDEGRYNVGHWKGCASTAQYEWWASAKCDSILPAAPPRVHARSSQVDLMQSVAHNEIGGLKPVNPWTIKEVAHILDRHRISTAYAGMEKSESRKLLAASQGVLQFLPPKLSEARLQAQLTNFEIVIIENKSCLDAGNPSLALLRSDGCMLFFPRGSAHATGRGRGASEPAAAVD